MGNRMTHLSVKFDSIEHPVNLYTVVYINKRVAVTDRLCSRFTYTVRMMSYITG